jgi:hypothetical protein
MNKIIKSMMPNGITGLERVKIQSTGIVPICRELEMQPLSNSDSDVRNGENIA